MNKIQNALPIGIEPSLEAAERFMAGTPYISSDQAREAIAQQARFQKPERTGPCDGACCVHEGELKNVHVWEGDKAWGPFNYCEAAIASDRSRGFTVGLPLEKDEFGVVDIDGRLMYCTAHPEADWDGGRWRDLTSYTARDAVTGEEIELDEDNRAEASCVYAVNQKNDYLNGRI